MRKSNNIRYIIIALALLALILFLVTGHVLNKPSALVVEGDAEFNMPAHILFAEFDENETEANDKYLNKIISVNGQITDISGPDSTGFKITLKGDGLFGVICEFPHSADSHSLSIGDSVTIKGLCTGKLMDVVMVKCIIENNQGLNEKRQS